MRPEPKQFTNDRPCSKVEIFACFWGKRNFRPRQVYEVEAELGRHVPRHMINAGRLRLKSRRSVDTYELTGDGKTWLREGIVRYLNNHPDRIDEVWGILPLSLRSQVRKT